MQLALKFRHLMPQMVVEEFDNIVATIRAFFNVEHKGDGTHGDIHADSITVGGVPMAIPLPNLGPASVTDPVITASNQQSMLTLDSGGGRAHLQCTAPGGGAASLSTNMYYVPGTGWLLDDPTRPGILWYLGTSDVILYTATPGAGDRPLTDPFIVQVNGAIRERSRTTPLGEWIAVPYSAANFLAATGTWTVPQANVYAYHYMLIGKTMFLNVGIIGSTISTATATLGLRFPPGIVAAQLVEGANLCTNTNAGPYTTSYAAVASSGTTVALYATPNIGPWVAGATQIRLFMTIPIQ